MALSDLTLSDREVVMQCIKLIVDGPYLMQTELQTRTGLTRAELEDARRALPTLTRVEVNDPTSLAISNCLNEVVNGIRVDPSDWSQWFDVPPSEVAKVLARWTR
jgi:hypothetical protein